MFSILSGLIIVLTFGVVSIIQHKLRQGSWINPQKLTWAHLMPSLITPRYSQSNVETKIPQDVKPYQCPPLKERSSSKMAMGLKRLDTSNWLTIDSNYLSEHALRCEYLQNHRSQVIGNLPGSIEACYELLTTVSAFLSNRFPQHYTIFTSTSGPMIQNHLTGETFPCGQNALEPLEIAAKLAMEDFNLLFKNQNTGDYDLLASATLFPAGWKLQERIGTSMANLHSPVPGWQKKLGSNVNRYFDHLSPKTAMERTNLFIQGNPDLFQDAPETIPAAEAGTKAPAAKVTIRRERQTFTRLPESNAICFTVRTFMQPLTELGNEELKALRSQVLGWEKEVRDYKGWGVWGETLMGWCEERVGKVEVEREYEGEKTDDSEKGKGI